MGAIWEAGNRNSNVVPRPISLVTEIRPPRAAEAALTALRPTPRPE